MHATRHYGASFDVDEFSTEALAKRFAWCSQYLYRGASPLYEFLSERVARDEELLRIAAIARTGQPAANLFFAAAHFLVLQDPQVELARWYPSAGGTTSVDEADPWEVFRDFCCDHRERMQQLIQTHGVQTNEVRRCACLLPAFGRVARLAHNRRLALIEIGTSAGLNLLWDRYHYRYSNGREIGDPNSPVQIECEVRGEAPPPIPETLPEVGYRVGIDLNPMNVGDPDQVQWLAALIWPEQAQRRHLLERAVEVAKAVPVPQLAGDAIELLPGVLDQIPEDMTVLVFHSYTLNQFRPEMREVLARLLVERATQRPIYRVSIEWLAGADPLLQATQYDNRVTTERILARCDDHGEWIEWYGADYN